MERRKEPERKDGEIQGQGKGEGPRGTPGTHPAPEEQPPASDGPQFLGVPRWAMQPHIQRRGRDTEEDWAPASLSSPSPPPEWLEAGGRGWQRTGHVPVSYSREPGRKPCRK